MQTSSMGIIFDAFGCSGTPLIITVARDGTISSNDVHRQRLRKELGLTDKGNQWLQCCLCIIPGYVSFANLNVTYINVIRRYNRVMVQIVCTGVRCSPYGCKTFKDDSP